MDKLVESLSSNIMRDLPGLAMLLLSFWFLLAKLLPKLLSDFRTDLRQQRTDHLAAEKEARTDFFTALHTLQDSFLETNRLDRDLLEAHRRSEEETLEGMRKTLDQMHQAVQGLLHPPSP